MTSDSDGHDPIAEPPQVLHRTTPPDSLEIVVWPAETAGRCDFIMLSGVLDAATSAETTSVLMQWIRSSPATSACVDLAEVDFFDAAGLTLLRRLHDEGNCGDNALHFSRPSQPVRRVLSMCGFDELTDAPAGHAHVASDHVPQRRPPVEPRGRHGNDGRHQGHRRADTARVRTQHERR